MRALARYLRSAYAEARLPPAARAERRRDRHGNIEPDPGIARVIAETVRWLGRAQDRSRSADGGVASDYSLIRGWSTSYPETTGYIVPTLLTYARLSGDEAARCRARRMLDWLVSIQMPSGGFQGGTIGETPAVPVVFNTGQILLGLAAGIEEFGEAYREPMRRAADWLVSCQDCDGGWRRWSSPFALPGERPYHVHAAWGLLEAARLAPTAPYVEAALANIRWALRQQHANGWFERCCLNDPARPLTHAIGYVLRGLVEAYRLTGDRTLGAACRRTADAIAAATTTDGFLPGRLDRHWRGNASWVCLAGSAQIAHCWLLLYQETGDVRLRDAAFAVNSYVRRTIRTDGPDNVRGAVKGSFPVHGPYYPYAYPNWAAKFVLDANIMEQAIRTA